MKGNNELHLNTATVIEAMQMWLDSKMPHGAPTVTDIKAGKEFTGPAFVVSVSGDADRPGPKDGAATA